MYNIIIIASVTDTYCINICLQKAEHKNTAQNLGRQYKVSPKPVPMPAIEADPALQESHGCPPATRTQSQHIAVNRRD